MVKARIASMKLSPCRLFLALEAVMMCISHWGCFYLVQCDRWTVLELLRMSRLNKKWFPDRISDYFL